MEHRLDICLVVLQIGTEYPDAVSSRHFSLCRKIVLLTLLQKVLLQETARKPAPRRHSHTAVTRKTPALFHSTNPSCQETC